MEDIKIKDKKMSDTFEVRGIWSKSIDNLQKGISGILKYSPDNIALELAGEINGSLETLFLSSDDADECEHIYGITAAGEYISLYDNILSRTNGSYPGIKVQEYHVSSFLVGGLYKKEDILFKNCFVYFNNFTEWIRKSSITYSIREDMNHCYEINSRNLEENLFSINIPSKELTIKEKYSINHSNGLYGLEVKSERYLELITKELYDLNQQLEIVNSIRKLFSFLINSPIHVEKLNIKITKLEEDTNLSYFYNQLGEFKKGSYNEYLFTYEDIKENIEKIFNNWLCGYDDLVNIYDLITADGYINSYAETIFLDSARALEVFHRSIFNGLFEPAVDEEYINECTEKICEYICENIKSEYQDDFIKKVRYKGEASFRARINDIFKTFEDVTLEYIVKRKDRSLKKSKNGFVSKVIATRNYLTHKDAKAYDKPEVIKDPVKQLVTAYQIKAIVIILIGKEIGIEETFILEKIINTPMYYNIEKYVL